MALHVQNHQPSLLDFIRTAQGFSHAERLYLAKALLDSLVLEESSVTVNDALLAENSVDEDPAVEREREAYIALHPILLKQYPHEHVAIHDGKLVDHDKDGLALSLRIHQRFPDEFVWIAPLKTHAIEEWVMRSPRFESIPE